MSQSFIKADRLAAVVKGIRSLVKKQVLVGIPDNTTDRDESGSMNNATLGYIHEFGSPAQNIPERPFLIPGIKDSDGRIEKQLQKATDAALSGKRSQVDTYLEAAGIAGQNSVKRKINSGEFAPLSDATLRARAARGRKGAKVELQSRAEGNGPDNSNARPLIDTGQLRNAITYVVRGK